MLLAEFAILFDLDSVGVVLFVFESIVISLFAFRTYERYFASCSFRCHNFTYNFLKKLHPFSGVLIDFIKCNHRCQVFLPFFYFFFFYYIFLIYIYKLKILRFIFPFTTRFFTRKTIKPFRESFFNFIVTSAGASFYIIFLNFKAKIPMIHLNTTP